MPALRYQGRSEVQTDSDGTITSGEMERLHTLVDRAAAAFAADNYTMRSLVVHFERPDEAGAAGGGRDMPRVHIDVEAEGDFGTLDQTVSTLAQQVVTIGMEPDTQSAEDNISLAR